MSRWRDAKSLPRSIYNSTYGYYEEKYGKNIKNGVYHIETVEIFKERYGYNWLSHMLEDNEIQGLAIKYKNADDNSMRNFLWLKEMYRDNKDILIKNGYLIF